MKTLIAAALAALALSGAAIAQPPASKPARDGATLTWLVGSRVHHNANGTLIYEAFIGPMNGVVTGTALSGIGTNAAYTEYHKFAPNADGVYGLAVMNSRTNAWSFTPMKSIEPGKVVFESADGNARITYWSKGEGKVGASSERTADGKTTRTEWSFDPLPAAK